MLTTAVIEKILATIPNRTIGVLGDLFLDRYFDLDAALTEPSLETGLDAYQVVNVRSCPGAAGTVLNNLHALGVGRIIPISMIGDDGEGYELRQELQRMPSVQLTNVVACAERRTPTYTKPMLGAWHGRETVPQRGETVPQQRDPQQGEMGPRELNRLDIKNRRPLPAEIEVRIVAMLTAQWASLDVLLVLDQVSEPECGVVTTRIRHQLAVLAERDPGKIVIVDSRERVGLFRNAWLKPNERECLKAAGQPPHPQPLSPERRGGNGLHAALKELARQSGRPIVCTRSDQGMVVLAGEKDEPVEVPAYPVTGPIDSVGAGDSSSAALACALASGASLIESAAFGNLVASITIRQIGTTGTASPLQVRERWREIGSVGD